MTIRDRELLDLLREEPELLAIADAVAETQRAPRRVNPRRALAAVALVAVALFALVLASPWERGDGDSLVLDRALAAVDTSGPVLHLTLQFDFSSGKSNGSLSSEIYYDKDGRLLRIVSRSKDKVLGDYTETGYKPGFEMFPGLLEDAGFYRQALASREAKVLDEGFWHGRPVFWLEVEGGGPGRLRIGVDHRTYRPLVFQTLDPSGSPAGFEAAVLGFEFVSTSEAGFQVDAPILVSGTVVGEGCRPARARVGVFLSTESEGTGSQPSVQVASGQTSADGRFTLRADPAKSPFREALARAWQQNDGWLNFDLSAIGEGVQGFGSSSFGRFVEDGRWWEHQKADPRKPQPVTLSIARDPSARC
ncbi:MAG: hypothetical protein AABM30_03790 [Actinomycetota bacterium]